MRAALRLFQQLMLSWTWSGDIFILLGLLEYMQQFSFCEGPQGQVELVWKRKLLLVAIFGTHFLPWIFAYPPRKLNLVMSFAV